MRYLNPFLIPCRNFEARRIFYEVDFGGSHKWKSSKNRFFQNGLKFDLDDLEYRFLVQNTSKTLQESISGHIISFRPISATLSKIEFSWKIEILAIFWIFDISQNWSTFGRKWPKIWLVAGNGLIGPPKHFCIPCMIFYGD